MKAQLVKRQDRFDLYNESDGSKIASTLPNPMGKLSFKNCEAIANGYDLNDIINENCDKWNTEKANGIEIGFQKAFEVLGDKKFDMSDIALAFRAGIEHGLNPKKPNTTEYIQSLQHVEWDVEIVMEKVKDETKIIGSVKGVKGSGNKITTYKSVPKLDADGCLILKKK